MTEVSFNYPLGYGAALFDFRAEIGDKILIAELKGKVEAKQQYEEAVALGQTTAILTESNDQSNIFQIKLGAFPPGEAK